MAARTRRSKAPKNPTVKDVSRLAGVSTATVSRVLAGLDEVSEDARQRVLDAVRSLNYQPNRNARNLRKNSTSMIGVIVSDIQNPFFGSVIRGVEKITIQDGYTILLGNSDEDPLREQRLIAMLLAEGVAGIIIAPTNADAASYCALFSSGTPYVVIDRKIEPCEADTVTVDGYHGSRVAMEHLIALGHTHIGLIGGLEHLSVMRERAQGYSDARAHHGLPALSDLVQRGNNRQDGGYRAMQALLGLDPPPTAVLIANNLMTLGGLQAIHQAGLNIPGQISLIGFDDMDWAPSLQPPLSVVAQPAYEMGERAAAALLARIREPGRPVQHVLLETQLILRASCRSLEP